jgi:hypothetical protein
VDPALSSLLGVVAGGAVTYVSQRGLDKRREKLELERERRAETRAIQAAETANKATARLVFLDLLSIFTLLRSSRDVGRWWIAILLPTGAWEHHCEPLCRVLTDHAFRQVGSTFAGVEAWNRVCEASRRYYWVRPHLALKQGDSGLTSMRDTLLEGSARALLELTALGFGTLEDDDPLVEMIRREAKPDVSPSVDGGQELDRSACSGVQSH